jgi:16S rRNA (uracil1498-N3)-methyltransferase
MNLLLFDRAELSADGRVNLVGRRAEHLLFVLGVEVGSTLRAGVLDSGFGEATILSKTATSVELRYEQHRSTSADLTRVLVLALPRPKVLSRCVSHAAALGFTAIALVRCQRSEKSHLSSHRLDPERTRQDCLLGLEQAGRVTVPLVGLFTRFKPFVEDSLEALAPPPARFVAHLGSATVADVAAHLGSDATSSYTLAVGPEGGFVPYEVALLEAHGFVAFGAPVGALRVESAISYFTGQLDALAALARRECLPPFGGGGR